MEICLAIISLWAEDVSAAAHFYGVVPRSGRKFDRIG